MRASVLIALGLSVLIPFFYNSCQKAGSGFASLQSSVGNQPSTLCKVAPSAPSPFAGRKVLLPETQQAPAGVQSKLQTRTLPSGQRLTVLLRNGCARQGLSQQASASAEEITDLETQAYAWVTEQSMDVAQIEAMAEADECVIGVAREREYKLQALNFNDPSYILQTHLESIRATEGFDQFYSNGGMGLTGSPNVIIAVLDSGVDWQHEDLAGSLWVHSLGTGLDATSLGGVVNYNPRDNSNIGHGTHVSGLIAAHSNNGRGLVGAMPYRARIMAIRVSSSSGAITTTSVVNGLQWAAANGAKVANLSLGAVAEGVDSDPALEAGIVNAVNAGMLVVTVIGNANTGVGQLIDGTTRTSLPGQYASRPGVIGVGSYDVSTGDKSFFSHYSTTYAEIGAPGAEQGAEGLLSAIPTSLNQGAYGRLAGTSQAAPLVSAAAGLAIGLIRARFNVDPTPAELESLILGSAQKSSRLAPYFKDGNRLDLMSLGQRIRTSYRPNSLTACP